MYTHFFGNFLYKNGFINKEELKEALKSKGDAAPKIGTLAMEAGFLTGEQVDSVIEKQKELPNLRFGEIAIGMGLLSAEDVNVLISRQNKNFLKVGQELIDKGILSNKKFEVALEGFRSKYGIEKNSPAAYDDERLKRIIKIYVDGSEKRQECHIQYFAKLVKNLVRYIGKDFVVLSPDEYAENENKMVCISQRFEGDPSFTTSMYAYEYTYIDFVKRLQGEYEEELDENVYEKASDFPSMLNGMFAIDYYKRNNKKVEVSNLRLERKNPLYEDQSLVFRVLYPFGEIVFEITL